MQSPDRFQFMELVETARQYCGLIDRAPANDDWLMPLCHLLPKLHAAVAVLHEEDGDAYPPELADMDDRFDLYSDLHSRLGDKDLYWLEYDDPEQPHSGEEHRTGSLADDLTDIYFELRRGLSMLDAADADEVARLWESGFRHHWGQHLVDAERQLYNLSMNKQLQ